MKHLFVWRIQAPEPLQDQLRLWDALERAMTYDRHMTNAILEPGDDHILVQFQYQGRDRWWILSRARMAALAAVVRARLPHKELKLVRIERLDSGHDNKGEARTEPQKAADYAKTKHSRWADLKAARAAGDSVSTPSTSTSQESPSSPGAR